MKRFGISLAASIAALAFLFLPADLASPAHGAPRTARRVSAVPESFAPAGHLTAAARGRAVAARRVGTTAARRSSVPVHRTGHGHVGRVPSARVYYVYYRSSPGLSWTVYGGYSHASQAQAAVRFFRSRGYEAFGR